jgi:D-beta-D-heptose 7-phosphate kinase/D-beta-D-heptose 1-phosphate adenosyltransferase
MTKVWVNGTFDIVHLGHIQMLKKAADLGDFLIVGVDSDKRVSELKGEDRPINKLISRITLLEAIKYVDRVVSFDSDEQLETLIKTMRPTIMVIGEEYRDKRIIGKEYVGEIVYFPKMEGFSSTNIINKLYDREKVSTNIK